MKLNVLLNHPWNKIILKAKGDEHDKLFVYVYYAEIVINA